MPSLDTMSDRQILIQIVKHRSLAENMANELMRRAAEDSEHDGH